MDQSTGGKRGRTEPIDEEFNSEVALKLLVDVIRNLNPEQISIVQSVGFGTLLQLSCSSIPQDVFNWLATNMDTTTGSIEFENGFSFTITRECVQAIMNLPIGPQPISFCSTPDILQSVNMAIHGQGRNPSVFELATLIKNGLSGKPFAQAFVLLANCVLLCPTNQSVPSSSYYNVIYDADRIGDFDWCSYVLQWLLLSVNKYKINGLSGNCLGCGLIPVISYFEFLIVTEIHLGTTIPRLPLWSDNVLKLYYILDSKGDLTFGKLPMKHVCSTPFARTSQKSNVSYDLPLDVVSFIESTYNSEDQRNVKKKLKTLSMNLHRTILTNTTRAISNCVDEVLHAFCNSDSNNAKDAALYFNEGTLHCEDLLHDSHTLKSKSHIVQAAAAEEGSTLVKDRCTSTREMWNDMIYYYMERSFPHLPEINIAEAEPNLKLWAKEISTSLVQNLAMIEQAPLFGFTNVDDYLERALVKKLDIPNFDEGYEPMSNLDLCKLNFGKPAPVAKVDCPEEKIYFTSCLDCPKGDIRKVPQGHVHSNRRSSFLHVPSLNEHLTGRRIIQPQPIDDNDSEYPAWNFGDLCDVTESPTTPVFQTSHTARSHLDSFEEFTDCPNETARSTGAKQFALNKSVAYLSPDSYEIPPINKLGNLTRPHGSHCSPMNNSEGAGRAYISFQSSQLNQVPSFQRYAFAVSERNSLNKGSVQFISGNTCGLPVNERFFKPLSLKHVQTDNTIRPSDMFFHSGQAAKISATGTNVSIPRRSNSEFTSPSSNTKYVICTEAEEELFRMLTTDLNNLTFSFRIFQVEERWAAEKTLALSMSESGYINEYLMDAFVKMILNDQRMYDAHTLKIGFIKHITFSEISEHLMNHSLDHTLYKKLFTELGVNFRLEHAGLVHVPCSLSKQWFLVVGNFMDQTFDVLNPSRNSEAIKPSVDAVVHNFKKLFIEAYPHCPNFNISNFKIRNVAVPKQNFKYDSGFFVLLFLLTYNGFEVPSFSNDDLPALKKKLSFLLVSNYYNRARKSPRINEFIAKHVSPFW